MRIVFLFLVMLLLPPVLTSCTGDFRPSLTRKSELYIDQWVRTSPLNVYIQPKNDPLRELSALFFPFRVAQPMDNPRYIGQQMMQGFWQNWTAHQVFGTMVYDPNQYYMPPERMIATAKARGADLVVTGVITYYLHGGTQADTSLSLQTQIYHVESGMLLWSMEQAGRMDYGMAEDWILVSREMRMPEDPMFAVLTVIADEMAFPVAEWSRGPGQ